MRGILHVFPYAKVNKGANILIYGLGVIGREYISQILASEYCTIHYIIDNSCSENTYKNIPVVKLNEISKSDFKEIDLVVVAIGNVQVKDKIINELCNQGCAGDKIISDDKTADIDLKCMIDILGDLLDDDDEDLQNTLFDMNRFISKIPYAFTKTDKTNELSIIRKQFCTSNKENFLDTVRIIMLHQNLQKIMKNVSGSVAEVGVYRGDTAQLFADTCNEFDRQLFLFDTFEGFLDKDIVGIDSDQQIQFQDTSLQKVKEIVGETDNIHYIKGYFPDTITEEISNTKYCFVHIDCDLYNPIKEALHFFWERLNYGGMIVVHDYSSGWWPGATSAVDEFCLEHKMVPVLIPDLSGSVVLVK